MNHQTMKKTLIPILALLASIPFIGNAQSLPQLAAFGLNGHVRHCSFCSYDLGECSFDRNGFILERDADKFIYNGKGQLIGYDGEKGQTILYYNRKGHLKKILSYDNENPDTPTKRRYRYFKDGNIKSVREICKGKSLSYTSVKYLKFDEKGNWTKRDVTRTETSGKYEEIIQVRTIEYYE